MIGERKIFLPTDFTDGLTNQRPSSCRKDIKDPETIVTFVFSPQTCSVLCNRVLLNESLILTEDLRRVVCYSPIITYGNDGGWDSPATYSIPFLSRKSQNDPFVTWGVTETIEEAQLEKLRSLSYLNLPGFVRLASIGLFEELKIHPSDVKVAHLKQITPLPIKTDDLEIVTERPFSIEYFPLGVIFNKQRKNSPLVAVIPIQISGNEGIESRENLLPSSTCVSNFQSALIEVAAQMGDSSSYPECRVDTWGQMVAKFWLDHFSVVGGAKTQTTHSIYLDEFLQLEKALTI